MLHRKLLSISLTFSLIVAFGFAQMGAMSHQFVHDVAYVNALAVQTNVGDQLTSSAQNTPAKSPPDHTVCEQCIGFGGLSHAHHTAAYSIAIQQNSNSAFSQTPVFTASLKSLSRSARAPPFSLV